MYHRVIADLLMVEMQKHQRVAVADPDRIDRTGFRCQVRPKADPLQHIGTPRCDCRRAPVERGIREVRRISPIDHRDLDPRARQRVGQGQSGHTGADDHRFDSLGLGRAHDGNLARPRRNV
jgi:hypothetical protein